jgi:hypothetical protein
MKKFFIGCAVLAFAALCVYLWQSDKPVITTYSTPDEVNSTIPQPTQATQAVISEGEKGMVGATIPVVVSLFETSLQSSITNSATSMTLVSGTDRAGTALSGYLCFTVDEGTSSAEFVCGTASSTAVSSLTRGISPLTGTSSVTSLKFAHRRGASVKITNYPQLAIVSRILNGNEPLPNALVYDAAVTSSSLASVLQNVASVAYVNSVALAGAPNASTIAKGVAQAASSLQLASGAALGNTGALLVGVSTSFASSSSATTLVPVTLATGKLSQGFLDLTASWTFSGTTTLAGTTTVSGALLIPTVLATSTAATNKSYVDNRFSYGNSTTTAINSSFPTTGTTTITSIPYTPSIASRVMVTFVATFATGNSSGNGCTASLYIDNNLQTNASVQMNTTAAVAGQGNASFTYITPQLTATSHTITITGQGAGATCSLATNPQMAIINIGN